VSGWTAPGSARVGRSPGRTPRGCIDERRFLHSGAPDAHQPDAGPGTKTAGRDQRRREAVNPRQHVDARPFHHPGDGDPKLRRPFQAQCDPCVGVLPDQRAPDGLLALEERQALQADRAKPGHHQIALGLDQADVSERHLAPDPQVELIPCEETILRGVDDRLQRRGRFEVFPLLPEHQEPFGPGHRCGQVNRPSGLGDHGTGDPRGTAQAQAEYGQQDQGPRPDAKGRSGHPGQDRPAGTGRQKLTSPAAFPTIRQSWITPSHAPASPPPRGDSATAGFQGRCGRVMPGRRRVRPEWIRE